ncbi:MAG: PorV/PorQ family protein [bacterium]
MKNKKLISLTVILTLMVVLYPLAGYAEKEVGGEPGSFLTMAQGARSLALGGAFVGLADDASALWANPAGLHELNKMEFVSLFAPLWEDTNYSLLGYAHPTVSWGTFAAGVTQISSKNFKRRLTVSDSPTNFNVVEQAYFLSYGQGFLEKFSAGASFKMVNQKIDTYSDSKLGVDIGAMYRSFDKKFSLGFNVQNVMPPKMKLRDEYDTYPIIAKMGGAYTFKPEKSESNRKLTLCFEMDYSAFTEYLKTAAGVEYWTGPFLALRLGKDTYDDLTFGFGFAYNDLQLDYALANHELGLTHRFSLTYRFGYIGESKYSEKAISKKIKDHDMKGQMHYEAAKYSQALGEWEKALIWNPADKEIQAKLERANNQLEAIVNKKLLEDRIDKAYISYEEGNMVESMEHWQEVSKLDPANDRAKEYIEKINNVLVKEEKEIYQERQKEKEILIIAGHIEKGQGFYRKKQYDKAIKEWKKVIAIRPDHLQASSKIRQAEDKIKDSIKSHLDNGIDFYNSGKTADAIRELKLVLSYEKDNEQAKDYLSKAEIVGKEIRKKVDPHQVNRLYYQAADMYLKGSYQESVGVLDELLIMDPVNENALKLMDKVQSVMEVLGKR